jgi:hypothetical protein
VGLTNTECGIVMNEMFIDIKGGIMKFNVIRNCHEKGINGISGVKNTMVENFYLKAQRMCYKLIIHI